MVRILGYKAEQLHGLLEKLAEQLFSCQKKIRSMPGELTVLLATATGIAVLHTLAGPDHYLPFIALSKLRGWSVRKTIGWTLLCGCGHVGSSVVLGLAGAALGWSLSGLIGIEKVRGGLASWALLVFGLLYFLWGLYRVRINKAHRHFDLEEDGVYVYEHRHGEAVRPRSETCRNTLDTLSDFSAGSL
jgi:hypothetical protein